MSTKYSVHFDDYTRGHYIKKLIKKFSQKQWDVTERALLTMAENAEVMLQTEQVRTIHEKDGVRICKFYFKIAGTKDSYKTSCCRCIAEVNSNTAEVVFLLVYHKDFLPGRGSETDKWQRIVKDNFSEYCVLIN